MKPHPEVWPDVIHCVVESYRTRLRIALDPSTAPALNPDWTTTEAAEALDRWAQQHEPLTGIDRLFNEEMERRA